MNGFSYAPTTNFHLPTWITNKDSRKTADYVARHPDVIHHGKDDIMAGGGKGTVYDTLTNGIGIGMYDNWNSIWTPQNRGGIRVCTARPDGAFSGGFLDPKFNSSPKLPSSQYLDVSTTFRKPYFNPVL